MKTLTKNIFRTFRRTWARFLSVSLLIGLAIFVFVGLFSAGPDMRQTVIRQFKKENLADVQVIDLPMLIKRHSIISMVFVQFPMASKLMLNWLTRVFISSAILKISQL